jgi:MOSC domain-containing protein YiiM
LSKAPFKGRVETLLVNPQRKAGLAKSQVQSIRLLFAGIEGDCHGGLTRTSDVRMRKQSESGTEVRNVRQISILSAEELADISLAMGVPEIKPDWVGANLVTRGIPDLTLLPPSTRLQFPSGATIVIDIENLPCRYPAEVIAKHYPEPAMGFVKAARHKRGVVGWVEREGAVNTGDAIVLWLPPQRIYAHA